MKNKPKNNLRWLQEGEEILFTFRRHMISMKKGFFLFFVFVGLGLVPLLIWQYNIQTLLLLLGGLFVGLIVFFYYFVLWYFTLYVVTDQRIRQITQHSFFGSEVVELRLSKVQNISYNIPGFIGEMLHFGTIVIQTLVGDLVIHKAEKAEEIYNKLQNAVNKIAESRGSSEEINW